MIKVKHRRLCVQACGSSDELRASQPRRTAVGWMTTKKLLRNASPGSLAQILEVLVLWVAS